MEDIDSKKQAIANRIKTAREMAGLSQGQVAKIMGVHRPTISEIEASRRKVSVEELSFFSKLFKVNISWLACEDETGEEILSDKIQLAARELKNLNPHDLERVIELLKALKTDKDK